MKIDLFIPCFIDQFRPQTGFNMVKVLEKAGCIVHYNIEQTCCGLPAFNAGHWDEAREIGEKLLKEITPDRNLVCAGTSCVGMFRNSYDLLFQNSSYHNRFRQLQKKAFELSEFLVDVLKKDNLGSRMFGKAAFMDTCTGLRECKIKTQPRQLLQNVEGLELLELENQEECCGFGGQFSVSNPEISVFMGNKKIEAAMAAGAQILVSSDYSCLMHLQGIIEKSNMSLKVMHLADVLAEGL